MAVRVEIGFELHTESFGLDAAIYAADGRLAAVFHPDAQRSAFVVCAVWQSAVHHDDQHRFAAVFPRSIGDSPENADYSQPRLAHGSIAGKQSERPAGFRQAWPALRCG